MQLLGAAHGGGGHGAQLRVTAHQVLDGDGPEHASFGPDLQTLLRLEGGLDAPRPLAPVGDPPCEPIDQLDPTRLHDVVDVAREQGVRVQRRVHPGERGGTFRLVDAPDAEGLLDAGVSREVQRHPAALGIHVVVEPRPQGAHERVDPARVGLLGLGRARDDEGDARLVHEQEVRLVDDGACGIALHALRFHRDEAVAQVVESRLARGEVGDVGPVGRPTNVGFHALADRRHAQPEGGIDRPHPRRVASREVVVRGHHVHPPARQGVEAGGEHRREGLALAGLHLGDPSPVQGRGGDDLLVVRPQAEPASGSLGHQCEHGHHLPGGSAPRSTRARISPDRSRSPASLSMERSSALTADAIFAYGARLVSIATPRAVLSA